MNSYYIHYDAGYIVGITDRESLESILDSEYLMRIKRPPRIKDEFGFSHTINTFVIIVTPFNYE